MLREAPASPPIMSQGSHLRVSSFPRGFHPRRRPPSFSLPPPLGAPIFSTLFPPLFLPRSDRESPFSPRYFTAPRSPLRVLYLLVFSGLVFIPNAASRMRTFAMYMYVYLCKYTYVFAHIHTWKVNACGPFWRLCERRHACGAHPQYLFLFLFLSPYLSSPSNPRDFSTPNRER